jgi:hypothetical protein
LLGAFAYVGKAPVAFAMSVRLAVSPHVTARLPLDGFSEIVETVIYVCRETLKFGYNGTKILGTFREDLKHRLLLLATLNRRKSAVFE